MVHKIRQHAVSEQVEIQQRSVEYFVMTNVGGNPTRLAEVMRPMPNFPNRVSALEGEVTTAGGVPRTRWRCGKRGRGGRCE